MGTEIRMTRPKEGMGQEWDMKNTAVRKTKKAEVSMTNTKGKSMNRREKRSRG